MIGVGKYAERRASIALKDSQSKVIVGGIIHPSPINPQANKNWKSIAMRQLIELGVLEMIRTTRRD